MIGIGVVEPFSNQKNTTGTPPIRQRPSSLKVSQQSGQMREKKESVSPEERARNWRVAKVTRREERPKVSPFGRTRLTSRWRRTAVGETQRRMRRKRSRRTKASKRRRRKKKAKDMRQVQDVKMRNRPDRGGRISTTKRRARCRREWCLGIASHAQVGTTRGAG